MRRADVSRWVMLSLCVVACSALVPARARCQVAGVRNPLLNRGVALYALDNPLVARRTARRMAQIPVQLTRTYLDLRHVWADPDAPNWAEIDATLSTIEQMGCQVLIHTQYVPRWLSQAPELTDYVVSGGGYVPEWAVYPPSDYEYYCEILQATFQRIAARHPGLVWGIEVGNEPDSPEFLRALAPEAPWQAYLQMYEATLAAVMAAMPDVRIGGPAASGSMASFDWIRMIALSPYRWDFCSAHYYGCNPERLRQGIMAIRSALDACGRQDTELVLSEWGFDGTGSSTITDTAEGAALAVRMLDAMDEAGLDWAIWFYDRDQKTDTHFGLLDYYCRPKPIFWSFANWGK